MKSAYLAGPMTGYEGWNFPAFHAAAADLRARGWKILSPAEHDEEVYPGRDFVHEHGTEPFPSDAKATCMRWDLDQVMQNPYLILLPGWEKSSGAAVEVALARFLGHHILLYPSLDPLIFHEAAMRLPADAAERKAVPLCTGVLDYFPDALAAVAAVSRVGNEQHHPGQPLHWDKSKSTDESDALLRHLVDRGQVDVDGMKHSAKVAWRALALLQREIEGEKKP